MTQACIPITPVLLADMNLYVVALLAILLARRVRVRSRLSLRCLPTTDESPWQVLWDSQDDDGLYHVTGFNIKTFRIIHDAIRPDLYKFWRGNGGRPSRLDTYATTALALYYLHRYSHNHM